MPQIKQTESIILFEITYYKIIIRIMSEREPGGSVVIENAGYNLNRKHYY